MRSILHEIIGAGREVARQFNADEMQALMEVHRRLPWRDLTSIDVCAACTDATPSDVPGAYSQRLAGRLQHLAYVGSDRWFNLPATEHVNGQRWADLLCDKVCALVPEEAVALAVILEAAQLMPPICFTYQTWWHPDLLLRLLAAPEFDHPLDL